MCEHVINPDETFCSLTLKQKSEFCKGVVTKWKELAVELGFDPERVKAQLPTGSSASDYMRWLLSDITTPCNFTYIQIARALVLIGLESFAKTFFSKPIMELIFVYKPRTTGEKRKREESETITPETNKKQKLGDLTLYEKELTCTGCENTFYVYYRDSNVENCNVSLTCIGCIAR